MFEDVWNVDDFKPHIVAINLGTLSVLISYQGEHSFKSYVRNIFCICFIWDYVSIIVPGFIEKNIT